VVFRRNRAPRVVLPQPGVLRRERRTLIASREERLRDLGGLIFEMYRQDRFNEELVQERCRELLEMDRRLAEIDELLDASTGRERLCTCSNCQSQLPPRSNFCPNCGQPALGEPPGSS
jgi:hypothetical protein